jgi:hypothetical protein
MGRIAATTVRAQFACLTDVWIVTEVINVDYIVTIVGFGYRPKLKLVSQPMGPSYALLSIDVDKTELSIAAMHLACGP